MGKTSTRQHKRRCGSNPVLQFSSFSGKTPIRDSCLDLVRCPEVLEDLNYPDEALQEINRILKPNGIAQIAFPKPKFTNRAKHVLVRFFIGLAFNLYSVRAKIENGST